MAVIILPDAMVDLLALQDYMLDQWGETAWLTAEDEIFEKLEPVAAGRFNGTAVPELAGVGIQEYQQVLTSHHKLVCRRIGKDTYVYLVAGQRQDYPRLLVRRLLAR